MTDSYLNWFDKNKFKNILAIIDSNKFNYRHKICEFRYIDIKDLVNNIENNKITEISAKKSLNTLKELKNTGITKQKKRTPKQKEFLNDFLDTISSHKTLMSSKDKNEKVNENEKEKEKEKEKENEKEQENEKTLMSSKDENEKQNKLLNNDNNENAKPVPVPKCNK